MADFSSPILGLVKARIPSSVPLLIVIGHLVGPSLRLEIPWYGLTWLFVVKLDDRCFIGVAAAERSVTFCVLLHTAVFLNPFSGLVKAAVFGFIIALMGCYHGYHSAGGAQGVGKATTNAVVSASILILAANYVLTSLLFTE